MAFTTSCFIRKNTSELRKKLEELGHTICKCCEFDGADWLEVSCNANMQYSVHGIGYTEKEGEIYGDITQEEVFQYFLKTTDSIDCGDNEELFLALAALRDDTNENQWFILDVEAYTNIHLGDWFIATDMNGGKHIGAQIEPTYCHKATTKEIIEHFNKK